MKITDEQVDAVFKAENELRYVIKRIGLKAYEATKSPGLVSEDDKFKAVINSLSIDQLKTLLKTSYGTSDGSHSAYHARLIFEQITILKGKK
jgi:hypothetical protein